MNKKIFLIKFPYLVFWILTKIKPQEINSLYGTLLFDSKVSNKKIGYVEQVTIEEGLNSL